jgi:hypothetical protein
MARPKHIGAAFLFPFRTLFRGIGLGQLASATGFRQQGSARSRPRFFLATASGVTQKRQKSMTLRQYSTSLRRRRRHCRPNPCAAKLLRLNRLQAAAGSLT